MENNQTSSGLSLMPVLFIVFLILKLTNNIDWSWWWVTCPLWAGVAILAIVFLIMGIPVLLVSFLKRKNKYF